MTHEHYANPTRISELWLKGLIKLVILKLAYKLLYPYLDTIQTQHTITNWIAYPNISLPLWAHPKSQRAIKKIEMNMTFFT
jgi:hypothetical protein